ncbi:hypothetical protein ACO34A_24170 (plasmid) [Rhizobium sp. ACO-34A]|nr:hypothetical protein ACO34A_24170 [Rhizobium sp. ACO-34A]
MSISALARYGFDLPRLAYAGRTALAACLAFTIAWLLGLEHPQWAGMTVWAASQPTRGSCLKKASSASRERSAARSRASCWCWPRPSTRGCWSGGSLSGWACAPGSAIFSAVLFPTARSWPGSPPPWWRSSTRPIPNGYCIWAPTGWRPC